MRTSLAVKGKFASKEDLLYEEPATGRDSIKRVAVTNNHPNRTSTTRAFVTKVPWIIW
jgi:hypothetical protein